MGMCDSDRMGWEAMLVVVSVSDRVFKSEGCFCSTFLPFALLPFFLFSMVFRLCVRQMLSLQPPSSCGFHASNLIEYEHSNAFPPRDSLTNTLCVSGALGCSGKQSCLFIQMSGEVMTSSQCTWIVPYLIPSGKQRLQMSSDISFSWFRNICHQAKAKCFLVVEKL